MRRAGVWLCMTGMAALAMLQGIAMAQPLLLSQLRDQVVMRGLTSGWFIQCTVHGSTNIIGSGRFSFEPDKLVALNFDRPKRYSIEFFSDGTQLKSVAGIKQKTPRHSPLGGLMFSIINMETSLLEHYFEIDLAGNINRFSILLIPKKRMIRILRSIKISGTSGLVDTIQLTTKNNRVVSVRLFPTKPPTGIACS